MSLSTPLWTHTIVIYYLGTHDYIFSQLNNAIICSTYQHLSESKLSTHLSHLVGIVTMGMDAACNLVTSFESDIDSTSLKPLSM